MDIEYRARVWFTGDAWAWEVHVFQLGPPNPIRGPKAGERMETRMLLGSGANAKDAAEAWERARGFVSRTKMEHAAHLERDQAHWVVL